MNVKVSLVFVITCMAVIVTAFAQDQSANEIDSRLPEEVPQEVESSFESDDDDEDDDDETDEEECDPKELLDNDPAFRCSSEGYYPDPASCKTFYYCDDDYIAAKMECCDGTLFDPDFHYCTEQANVNCQTN